MMSRVSPPPPEGVAARTFAAKPALLGDIRRFVRQEAERSEFDFAADDLVLATSEAATNSMRHTRSAVIEVTVQAAEHEVEVQVRDQGSFRRRTPASDRSDPGRRGLLLMLVSMDEVSIRSGSPGAPGTVVRLVKRRAGSAGVAAS